MPNVCLLPTKDARIDGKAPTTNDGAGPNLGFATIYIDGVKSYQFRTLATWQIPPEVKSPEVYKAFILLRDYGIYTGGAACSLYRVTAAWTEMGATWNKRDVTNNWAVAGGDVAEWSTAINFTTLSTGVWLTIDVTTAVVEAITSYSSLFDILLSIDDENTGANAGELFWSNDNTALPQVHYHPYLLIVRPPFGQPVNV